MNEASKPFKKLFMRKVKRTILTVVLLIALVGVFIVTKNRKDNKTSLIEKDTKIEEIKRQIEEEEKKNKSLKEKQEYVPYEEYIEEVARDALGLIKDNEIIIRPNEK